MRASLARLSRVALVLGAVGCSNGSQSSRDAATDASPRDAHQKQEASIDAGPPSLTMLSVSGAASGLVPAFEPGISDYYVRCASATNALQVSMTASPGSTSSLVKPTSSASLAMQTVSVSVNEGAAIVAAATAGSMSTKYWVRCLPGDFPTLSLTAYPDAGTASPGYYLVGNAVVPAGESGYAMILDSHGVPVWFHRASAGLAVSDVDSPASGAVSFVTTSFIAYYPFTIDQLSPAAISTVSPMGYTPDEHELQLLPNGHYLTFSYALLPGVDLTGLSISLPEDAGSVLLGPNSTIQDCVVLEVAPDGTVVWTWSATDHLDPAKVSTYPQTGFGPDAVLPDGGTTYDVYHCTAIDVDPANGNLLVSSRGTSSVFYVDKASGKVLWKMGGVDATLDDAAYVSVADPFFEEHDGRLLPGWSATCNGGTGQVSVFDDESSTSNPARGVIYDVVVGGSDGGCEIPDSGTPGQASVAWQYKGITESGGAGSLRINPDDTRIIGWGIGTPVFTEVDVSGNKLLELEFTSGDVSYRAVKVALSAFDLSVLHATAGM